MKKATVMSLIAMLALAVNLVSSSSSADQVIADDLIVTSSTCVGFGCLTDGTEYFGFDTIRLKGDNLRIKFQDTSTTAGFPTTDWQIIVNDSSSSGRSYFGVDNVTSSRSVLRIFDGTGGAVVIGEGSTDSGANTMSVGSAGNERRITNVAPGVNSTDAATYGQLSAETTARAAADTTLQTNINNEATSRANADAATLSSANHYTDISIAAISGNANSSIAVNNTSGYANPSATGTDSVAAGGGAVASAPNTVAVGSNARATGTNAIAIGAGSLATGSVAVGTAATASNGGSAFGDFAAATGRASVAVGQGATSTGANSVAIGSNSTDGGQSNVVSVGSSGNERRVTNVADGIRPTDAVNVRQLARTEQRISNLREDSFSGIASVAALAAIPDPSPGKRNSLGIGYGNYKGENAVALGYKSEITSNIRVTAGVAYSSNNVTTNAGVGFSW